MSSNLKRVAVIVLGLGVAGVIGYQFRPRSPAQKVSYPYVCRDCGAVVDVQEIKKPGNHRSVAGAPGSVVLCLKCNKGKSYPVATCDQCGTRHLLYIVEDDRCPKCFPYAAKAAQKLGIDAFFKETR